MLNKLNDERVKNENLIREYEVFTFTKEEVETSCNYDAINGAWKVYTNYQPHITKLFKLNNAEIIIESVNLNGTVTSVTALLDGKQIGFANKREKREYTEEDLAKMRERAKALHK